MRYLISGSQRAAGDVLNRLIDRRIGGWSRIQEGGMRGHYCDREGTLVKILTEPEHIRGLSLGSSLYVVPVGPGWHALLMDAMLRSRREGSLLALEYLAPPEPVSTALLSGHYAPRADDAVFLAQDPATGDWLKVSPLNNHDLPDRAVLHKPTLRWFVPDRWMPCLI